MAPDGQTVPETQAQVDAVLATVNGEAIILSEVVEMTRREEMRAMATLPPEKLAEKVLEIRRKCVDEIIKQKLILADYKETKPGEIPDQYVENAIDDLIVNTGCTTRREFEVLLKKSGETMGQIRDRLRDQLAVAMMIARVNAIEVNVTPQELYDYYEEHVAEFNRPAATRLQVLIVPAEKNTDRERAELAKALDRGADFAALCTLYGKGTTDSGFIPDIALRPEFAAILGSNPQPGQIYGPAELDGGLCYLKVLECRPEETVMFSEVGPELRKRLEEQQRNEAIDRYVQKLREKASIEFFF